VSRNGKVPFATESNTGLIKIDSADALDLSRQMKKNTQSLAVLGAMLVILSFAAVAASSSPGKTGDTGQPGKADRKSSSVVAHLSKEAAVPFHLGESLNYRVAWATFATAASLQVTVPERRELYGASTWHFRAALHTQSPVRSLFTIDDQFDSYTDAFAFDTRRYETYQSELGRKEDHVLNFMSAGRKASGQGPDVMVLPGTRDPVGAFYALRNIDWQQTPEFRVPLYDGHDIYQLTAHLDAKSELVTVAAGNFKASRIGVKLSQYNKQVADITFDVWLANDAARTPIQLQAKLPFGSVRAELLPRGK
jgi:hypothetical protein